MQNIIAPKNGYVYIYVSNESPVDVFFDNLQVIHTRAAILEETHYYPFGLTMAGISSKALAFGKSENKRGYNGNEIQNKEFSDESGLEFYDFNARTYDQQIGRFLQIDPESEEGGQGSWSLYHFGFNNPILNSDPDGRHPIVPTILRGIWTAYRAFRAYRAIQQTGIFSGPQRAYVPINIPNRAVADATAVSQGTFIDQLIIQKSKEKERQIQLSAEKADLSEQAENTEGQVKSLERSVKSLEKNVEEHEQKLEDYKDNPDAYDNKGQLQNVSPELRQQIINGRIKSLEKQIRKNKGELQKANEQLQKKRKELENINDELKKLE